MFEAMKMQHEILASVSGVIRELNGQVGKQMAGDIVMVIERTVAMVSRKCQAVFGGYIRLRNYTFD